MLKDYNPKSLSQGDIKTDEVHVARNLFSLVLCYYMHSVKGGWQHLEETVNFLLHSDEVCWEFYCTLRLLF